MMHPFPHRYTVRASGPPDGLVTVKGDGLSAIHTSAPPEFGGPEGNWSPESLLVAAVADCFVLSFRAVARASALSWRHLDVAVEGLLDKADGAAQFTQFILDVRLVLDPGAAETLARATVAKAKRACLVTNSLKAECEVRVHVAH